MAGITLIKLPDHGLFNVQHKHHSSCFPPLSLGMPGFPTSGKMLMVEVWIELFQQEEGPIGNTTPPFLWEALQYFTFWWGNPSRGVFLVAGSTESTKPVVWMVPVQHHGAGTAIPAPFPTFPLRFFSLKFRQHPRFLISGISTSIREDTVRLFTLLLEATGQSLSSRSG